MVPSTRDFEAVTAFLASRIDSYPWLFISQSRRTEFRVPSPLSARRCT